MSYGGVGAGAGGDGNASYGLNSNTTINKSDYSLL